MAIDARQFWPDGIRLVISISMQFEAGGQPAKGTDSPFPKVDFPENISSDAAANTWFAYGYREGIPRMLDLWDRHGIKVTSHMIGEAVQRHPTSLAKLWRAVTRHPVMVQVGVPSTR
jgi:peptidoglycan/xylan/chitin deacetylase (PgdA/CDA1 family)